MTDDRLSWIYDDPSPVARLNEMWSGWDDPNDGLASQLDNTPGWDGWDSWSTDDKLAHLAHALDAWYPPDGGGAEEQVDRMAWVREDPALAERLDQVWPGWAEADGLAATLDHTAEWNGWDVWESQAKRDYLRVTLDAWYPPASGVAEPADTSAAAGLDAGLTEVLTQVLHTVPGAADLSEEELGRILSEVLAEQKAALPS